MQQTYARSTGVYEKVVLADLLADVVGIAQAGMERHSIVLHTESEELPLISTDRHKVLQILLNLVRNAKDAVKASCNETREITICMLRVNGERVAIRVADNGIGISPADLSRFSLMDLRQKRMATGLDCIPELLLPNNWEAL